MLISNSNENWKPADVPAPAGLASLGDDQRVQIPRGMPDRPAQEFISTGLLEIPQAHAVWKRYANGFTSKARTVQTVKARLSRLRRAVRKEGHRPHGTRISWLRDRNCWQARIKFGDATRREKGGVGFQTRY